MPSPQVNLSRFGQTVAGVTINGNTEISPATSGTTIQVDAAAGGGTGVLVNGNGTALTQITDATQPVVRLYDTVETFDLTMSSHAGFIRTLGAHDINIATNSTTRINVNGTTGQVAFPYGIGSLTGPLVINAPATSVPTLKSTGPNGNWAEQLIGSSTANQSYGLSIQAGTNVNDFALQISNQSTSAVFEQILGDGSGFLGPNGTHNISWNTTGNFTIAAPNSGIACVVNGIAANPTFSVAGTTNGSYLQVVRSGTRVIFVGSADSLISGGNATDGAVMGLVGLRLGANNGIDIMDLSSTGNVTINAPSSGDTLEAYSLTGNNSFVAGIVSASNNPRFVISHTESSSKTSIKFTGSSNPNGSIAVGNTDAITLSNGGNITIVAPAGGTPFTVDGLTGTITSLVCTSAVAINNVARLSLYVPNSFSGNEQAGIQSICENGGNQQVGFGIFTTPAGGGIVTRVTISSAGAVAFPSVSTTASAANAFLDSGSSPVNNLLRSTSSIRYKTDVQEYSKADALQLVRALHPVTYRSLCEADDPNIRWHGLIAEEVAEVDPMLVHWSKDKKPESVQYERVVCALIKVLQELLNA